ncbi:MAG: hypothetical protein IJH20_00230 [Bacilli bacterium]|nr:hypothetical protein [Bacilli bacterium]
MKAKEKEEVKEIVQETIKEQTEPIKTELKKEKKDKKKAIIIGSIVGVVLFAVVMLLMILYFKKPTYKVTVKDGGGKIIKDIVIENNTVKSLPEYTPPEGKRLVTWVNKKGEAVRSGIKLEDDDVYEPIIGDPIEQGKTVTLSFDSKTGEVIPDIIIPKGSEVILPARPNPYKDWKFLFWVYHDDYVVIEGTKIYEDTHIEAYWWIPSDGDTEEVTIKYDTGTDEKLDPVTVVKGSHYVFKTPTKQKDKLKFKGWLDESGNLLTADSTVEKDITIKAKWIEPYTCPADCIPTEDGTKCTKTTIVEPSKQTICPATEWTNDYGQTYCIDLNTKEYDRQCASAEPFGTSEVDYTYQDGYDQYGPIIKIACVKKVDYVEQNTCPAGYDRDGEKCKLVETIDCTSD